ncbi:MAG: hypothetical protein ACRCVN_02850 [Spirochaetia bacterium]
MKSIRKFIVYTNLCFISAFVLCTLVFWILKIAPGTPIFTVSTLMGSLIFLCLFIFNILALFFQDLITALLMRDIKDLKDKLEIWIFQKERFWPFLISYYLLLSMRMGLPWKIHDLELLVLSRRIKLFPDLAHFFSLHYMSNTSMEEAQTWYSATLKYKKLQRRHNIYIDYILKLISENKKDAALPIILDLLRTPVPAMEKLIGVYLCFMILDDIPSPWPLDTQDISHLRKHENWLIHKKDYLSKILNHSHSYEIDIHKILLANITKQALGWLKSWKIH